MSSQAAPYPAAKPANRGHKLDLSASHTAAQGDPPKAMRIPISGRRWTTESEITG